MKKLYRSKDKRILGGVLGGLGTYFDIDPTILRLAYAFVTLFTGFAPGVILYVLALFIMPAAPRASHDETHTK
jgi:phage shock protein C